MALKRLLGISLLANQFLIAMPWLEDPTFAEALIYLVWHSQEGAAGLIINRPTELNAEFVFDQLGIDNQQPSVSQSPLLFGGPVDQERGFVIHRPMPSLEGQYSAGEQVSISTTQAALKQIAQGKGPEDAMIALGYAGWEANQLDAEIQRNIWLTSPVDPKIIFDAAYDDRWRMAVESLGIDPQQWVAASSGGIQ